MRLITVRIQPSVPDLSAESMGTVLDAAGVRAEHVYVDVTGSVTRIAVYVRCEALELGPTADAVLAALAIAAGEDRLVQARTHSWADVAGETGP